MNQLRYCSRIFCAPILFATSFSLFFCTFKKTNSSAKEVSVNTVDFDWSVTCKTGSPVSFIGKALDFTPELAQITKVYPNAWSTYSPHPAAPNFRIDACMESAGELTIQRLLTLEAIQQRVPKVGLLQGASQGLSEAVFAGDFSKISLEFLTKDNLGLVLRGWRDEPTGKTFLTLTQYLILEDKTHRIVTLPMAATIESGDFAQDGKCPLGQVEKKNERIFGKQGVTVNSTRCTWGFGFGTGTTYYKYIEMRIKDDSLDLLPENRGKETILSAADLKDPSLFDFQQNHHNSCDAVVVTLPFATYAWTNKATFTMDGACKGFKAAPARAEPAFPRKFRPFHKFHKPFAQIA